MDRYLDRVIAFASKIADNKYLSSLRDGFMAAFPATMFASIAMIIQNFPATFGFSQYLPKAVMDFLNNFLGPVGNATMSVSNLFFVFAIGYHLAKKTSL